jgi:hypothetical protein
MRNLLKRLIIWALASDEAKHDPAGLDTQA